MKYLDVNDENDVKMTMTCPTDIRLKKGNSNEVFYVKWYDLVSTYYITIPLLMKQIKTFNILALDARKNS